MYSRKKVGPRVEPWETPALIRHFCEAPTYNLLKPSVTEGQIPIKKKALDISSATAPVAPNLLKPKQFYQI